MADKFGTTLIPFCFLVVFAFCRTGYSFDADLQEQIQQLKGNYERMALKVNELTEKVTELESQLLKENSTRVLNDMRRSCSEIKSANPDLNSGMYWIDPDGQNIGDDPIYVHCDMSSGTSSILHDSEEYVEAENCFDPGCYTREIHYSATERQITKLIELSNECHQFFKYDCIEAPFEYNGQKVSWWDDRHGNQQLFWSGKYTNYHTCACGLQDTCIGGSNKKCNCDSQLSNSQSDEGIITDKDVLPIKSLHFGRTSTGSGGHTLGRLQCSGQMTNEIVDKIPTSCADLMALGHSSNGFYLVQGTKIVETVYCDFTKFEIEEGFEKWIGYADLKNEPTYHGLPKSCADLRGIGHTSFSSGMYSIMGKKFIEMVYCDFSRADTENGFQTWMGYADLKAEPTFSGMPKSCSDLKGIGHTAFSSGFYPILGEKLIEMVYCNFDSNPNGLQTKVGVIDVKSIPTFFYGQRDAPWGLSSAVPFDVPQNRPLNYNVVNIGNAWDIIYNRFVAPVKGRYFFSASGTSACRTGALTCQCFVSLMKRTISGAPASTIARALGEVDMERRDKTSTDSETFSMQATLDLNKDDKVWLEIDMVLSSPVATLYDDSVRGPLTHFTGILLQEDIADSLVNLL